MGDCEERRPIQGMLMIRLPLGNWGWILLGTSGRIHLRVIPTKGQGSWVIFPPISIYHRLRTALAGFNCHFWPDSCEGWAPFHGQRKPSRRKEQFPIKPLIYREDRNAQGAWHGTAWIASATVQNWKGLWTWKHVPKREWWYGGIMWPVKFLSF